eukprot:c48290_g1_i1.p1 GENE.c48290_g1_i1~~c48290_g1_i1.p1  ORF type:complete len:132 (-),score=10.22 c48290_g1_i1:48-443(-)
MLSEFVSRTNRVPRHGEHHSHFSRVCSPFCVGLKVLLVFHNQSSDRDIPFRFTGTHPHCHHPHTCFRFGGLFWNYTGDSSMAKLSCSLAIALGFALDLCINHTFCPTVDRSFQTLFPHHSCSLMVASLHNP